MKRDAEIFKKILHKVEKSIAARCDAAVARLFFCFSLENHAAIPLYPLRIQMSWRKGENV